MKKKEIAISILHSFLISQTILFYSKCILNCSISRNFCVFVVNFQNKNRNKIYSLWKSIIFCGRRINTISLREGFFSTFFCYYFSIKLHKNTIIKMKFIHYGKLKLKFIICLLENCDLSDRNRFHFPSSRKYKSIAVIKYLTRFLLCAKSFTEYIFFFYIYCKEKF